LPGSATRFLFLLIPGGARPGLRSPWIPQTRRKPSMLWFLVSIWLGRPVGPSAAAPAGWDGRPWRGFTKQILSAKSIPPIRQSRFDSRSTHRRPTEPFLAHSCADLASASLFLGFLTVLAAGPGQLSWAHVSGFCRPRDFCFFFFALVERLFFFTCRSLQVLFFSCCSFPCAASRAPIRC